MVSITASDDSPISRRFEVNWRPPARGGSFAFCSPVHKEFPCMVRSSTLAMGYALMVLPALGFAQQAASDSVRLHQLFAQQWDYTMREYPEFATSVGYPGQNARWTDYSLEAIARRKRELNDPLNALRTIDRAKLGSPDQLNYDLFRRNLTVALEESRFPGELMAITQLDGVQQDVPSTIAKRAAGSVADYEDILARLRAVPVLVNQPIVLRQGGLAAGITPPRITLRDVPSQAQDLLVDDPLASPLLTAFRHVPAGVPAAERERLHAAAVAAYRDSVAPAFRKLSAFLRDTYLPGARTTTGMRDLPNGLAWYQVRARASTTTDLTPDQIHAMGLAEVKRIRGAMDRGYLAPCPDCRTVSRLFLLIQNARRPPRTTSRGARCSIAPAPTSSTPTICPPARSGRWKPCRSTKRCPDIICRLRWHKSSKACPSSASAICRRCPGTASWSDRASISHFGRAGRL